MGILSIAYSTVSIMSAEDADVFTIILERICTASPCSAPVEIKKLARLARKDANIAQQVSELGKQNGVEINLSNDIEAYLSISKLVNKICSSLI